MSTPTKQAELEPVWTIVVAMADGGVIGNHGGLPWRLSSDLQRFKRMTMGHCLLMGRKTFESIGRALPGRQTIVMSRRELSPTPEGVTVVDRFEAVNPAVLPGRQVMVVGGGQIYAGALPYCKSMWVTRVLAEVPGDVVFPPIEWTDWELESSARFEAGPKDDWPTEFQIWQRP